MKKLKYIIPIFVLCLVFAGAQIKAADNNIPFKFHIQMLNANTKSAARYRQTTNVNNPWKVNLRTSTEGAGTITNFWLEGKNNSNVSKAIGVKQGSGAHYTPAYKTASKTNVKLTGENNNTTFQEYNVTGYWDEETH